MSDGSKTSRRQLLQAGGAAVGAAFAAPYILTSKGAADWGLAPAMALGALLSVPLAGITVKKMTEGRLRLAVGIAVTALGSWTLYSIIA